MHKARTMPEKSHFPFRRMKISLIIRNKKGITAFQSNRCEVICKISWKTQERSSRGSIPANCEPLTC
jgi:hypothetical protein